MSMESLMRAAEAAGFAMVSDENERPVRRELVLDRPPVPVVTRPAKTPRDVLSFAGVQATVQERWNRAHFGSLLPAWHAKG